MSGHPQHTARNLLIYQAWKAGKTFAQLAEEYKLTAGRIKFICQVQEHKERRK